MRQSQRVKTKLENRSETLVRNVPYFGSCRGHKEPIVVDKHVARVAPENDVNPVTAADYERHKRHVADVNSDVLMRRRAVKYST